MKSFQNLSRSIFLGCIAIGALGLLAPSLTLADGKGSSKLMFVPATSLSSTQTAVSGKAAMDCPRCTDGYARVVEKSGKTMLVGSVKSVPVHQCPACQTKIVSVGVGKAKTDRADHSCGNSASSATSCCMAVK